MRKYLFGTGIIGAVTSGFTLLRGSREEPFTWRTALAWASWGITLALAIGAIVDTRRQSKDADYKTPAESKTERKILRRMR